MKMRRCEWCGRRRPTKKLHWRTRKCQEPNCEDLRGPKQTRRNLSWHGTTAEWRRLYRSYVASPKWRGVYT